MLRFLREVLASTFGILLAVVLVATFLLSGFEKMPAPGVPDKAVLVIDCSLPFVDNPTPPVLADAILGGSLTSIVPLARVRDALRAAADDPRIVGLELTGYLSYTGWAMLEELRREVAQFRRSGKPVMADFLHYDEATLFLASAADSIYLPPLGDVEWNGFAIEVEYLARALAKAGVEVQVTRVGKYKSAVEPYLADSMSEENRAQLQAILRQREELLVTTVAAAREIEVEQLRQRLQTAGILSATEAMELGLVDGVRYWDESAAEFRDWSGEAYPGEAPDFWYTSIALEDYVETPAVAVDEFAPGATVAVVYAEGDIVDQGAVGQVVAPDLALQLSDLRLNDDIAAVVLRVQSPGGSATASEIILREMQLLVREKPVVVSMGDVAASGGYWIACQANEIFAEESTVTGSIGVFGMYPNAAQLADKLGVDIETVATGPHAGLYSMFQSKTEATLDRAQASVDRIYDGFLDRVAAGRELERGAVHEIAQGRVWVGSEALALGLVDRIGSLDDAIGRAAEMAGLKEGFAVSHEFYEPDEWERLLHDWLSETEVSLATPSTWGVLSGRLQRLLPLVEPRSNPSRVWARLPYTELR